VEVPQPKNPLMLKIFFGNQMDRDQLAIHLRNIKEYHTSLVKQYEKEVKPIIQRYASIIGASNDARYWALTLEFGRMHAKMVAEWCQRLLKTSNEETVPGITKLASPLRQGGSCHPVRGHQKKAISIRVCTVRPIFSGDSGYEVESKNNLVYHLFHSCDRLQGDCTGW